MDIIYIAVALGLVAIALLGSGWIVSTGVERRKVEKRLAAHAKESALHLVDADNPHQGDLERIIEDLSKATDEEARYLVSQLTEKLESLRKQQDS